MVLLANGNRAQSPKATKLNRAIKASHDTKDVKSLRAVLRPMEAQDMMELLDAQDANGQTPREAVSKYFPGQEAESTLGALMPRTKFNSEEDQIRHETAQKKS